MKDNHTPEPTLSMEEHLALMLANGLIAPTKFEREIARSGANMIGLSMSADEIKRAMLRAAAIVFVATA